MKLTRLALVAFLAAFLSGAVSANAAFIVEPNGVGSANFGFGGDTTTASNSTASTAVGTSGAQSVFGGDGGALPDTYLYNYTPGVDGDNVGIATGFPLNTAGDVAFGLTAGGSGTYRVYATWPFTSNVSGGDTRYALGTSEGDGSLFDVTINQNGADGNGTGHEWFFLGEVALDASTNYVLTQQPTSANSFVSMRSGGILFEAVPEPTAAVLAALGLAGFGLRRRV